MGRVQNQVASDRWATPPAFLPCPRISYWRIDDLGIVGSPRLLPLFFSVVMYRHLGRCEIEARGIVVHFG